MMATVDVDEMAEMRKNNIAQAILLAAVLLGMAFFIRDPLQRFISSLVNYESLEQIETVDTIPDEAPRERVVATPRKNPPERPPSPDGADR